MIEFPVLLSFSSFTCEEMGRYRIFNQKLKESPTPGLERDFTSFISSLKPCIPSEDHKAGPLPALPGPDWPQAILSAGAESAAGTAGSTRSK